MFCPSDQVPSVSAEFPGDQFKEDEARIAAKLNVTGGLPPQDTVGIRCCKLTRRVPASPPEYVNLGAGTGTRLAADLVRGVDSA